MKFTPTTVTLLISVALCSGAPIQWAGNGHYYEGIDELLSWSEATALATSQGGYLVTITSQAEQDFVAANFGGIRRWIGLTDSASEGVFVWVTGEPLVYTNWDEDEPNDSNNGGTSLGEDFAELRLNLKWNDVPDVRFGQPWLVASVIEYNQVPEPATLFLLGGSVVTLMLKRRTRPVDISREILSCDGSRRVL